MELDIRLNFKNNQKRIIFFTYFDELIDMFYFKKFLKSKLIENWKQEGNLFDHLP